MTITDTGTGLPCLLLHGGGGPRSVAGFAQLLSETEHARVIIPVHPGFGGTPRPDALHTIGQLADTHLALLEELDLHDVTVIGNSIGGWIASEMAQRDASDRISRLVLANAVGIDVPDHPVGDFFSLTMPEVFERSFYDLEKFAVDPTTLPAAQQQIMASNRQALFVYAGDSMTDPSLAERLGTLELPMLVVWGEYDRIVDPEYGRAYAAAIPGAEFALLTETGHMPQMETPEKLLAAVLAFAGNAFTAQQ